MHQMLPDSPEFYGRYYEKHFGLFFPGHTVYHNVLTAFVPPPTIDGGIMFFGRPSVFRPSVNAYCA